MRLLKTRSPSLAVLSSAAFVLSRRCLQAHHWEAMDAVSGAVSRAITAESTSAHTGTLDALWKSLYTSKFQLRCARGDQDPETQALASPQYSAIPMAFLAQKDSGTGSKGQKKTNTPSLFLHIGSFWSQNGFERKNIIHGRTYVKRTISQNTGLRPANFAVFSFKMMHGRLSPHRDGVDVS